MRIVFIRQELLSEVNVLWVVVHIWNHRTSMFDNTLACLNHVNAHSHAHSIRKKDMNQVITELTSDNSV